MTLPFVDPTFRIYLALTQFPILRTRIRSRMREELFSRGIISKDNFSILVREQAIESQAREGLTDPFGEEPPNVWRDRLARVRTHLTDIYFANNLSYELFEEIVRQTLAERGATAEGELLSLNAEISPTEILVEQAVMISRMPAEERKLYEPRLQEIKVVLIRNMISDQLAYIKIAKNWFTLEDLLNIRMRKIGTGKIGGKAAGMLLAQRILLEVGDEDIKKGIKIPDSYFLAADVMYAFMAYNNLMHWAEQKYKDEDQIRADYPKLKKEYLQGNFPPEVVDDLSHILEDAGSRPLIVRSSSLLEDNFGTSFAGKYESVFCPNQGTPEKNLEDFIQAIIQVYASALNPDALLYRRSKDLIDYDERIAVLIQVVEGEEMGELYIPHAAGVAFSRNMYRWSPQIQRDAGFLRLVWGLGTRAVDRVGSDFPRLVALSHPLLHTQSDPRAIRRYSQKEVDFIDLKDNSFKTLPVEKVLNTKYPILRYVAQVWQDGYLSPIRSNLIDGQEEDLVITMDELLRRTPLADRMSRMLQDLEREYKSPVDMEFTVEVLDPSSARPEVEISILQCRPQSHLREVDVSIPPRLPEEDVIFSTGRVLPQGHVYGINYVLFVTPEGYFGLPNNTARTELGRAIGKLNSLLKDESFICIGPGRWGTTTPDLGVRIGYADIYNSKALIELSGEGIGSAPEPSFGTHFFQDLIEANIYPLAIYLDDEDVVFNRSFFYEAPNRLLDFLPKEKKLLDSIHLIKVSDFSDRGYIELIMDDEAGRAVAFISTEAGQSEEDQA